MQTPDELFINQLLLAIKNEEDVDENFDKLYNYMYGHVYCVVVCNLNNMKEWEDVVVAAFGRIVKSIHNFNPKKNGVNWIYKIAQNTAWACNRDDKKRFEVDIDIQNLPGDTEIFNRVNDQIDVGRVLLKLSPTDKEIVMLKYFAAASQKEIAKKLHMSPSAICQRLAKIHEFIKEELNKE